MITHDVDEAILLADRIVLMTNGPQAKVAEIVRNPLPRDRHRDTVHKAPGYYALRNHLVDFLVTRSRPFNADPPAGYDPRNPPVVTPGAEPSTARRAEPAAAQPAERIVVPLRH
jgi:nitrate/nitrite transport system ATP-binding protein